MIWTKETHRSAEFQAFGCSREISPSLYFDRLLLLKIYKILAKKVWKIYVSWHRRVMQNFKKKWFAISKMTCKLEILKVSALIGSFRENYRMFELKKYRGVVFHDTE